MTNVAVVGLGKLGAPLAVVLASKGHDVIGIDLSDRTVQLVNEGRAPVDEPGLQELISVHRSRLRATTDLGAAAEADISILLVPTPSTDSGAFSNEHVLAATDAIGKSLAGASASHLLVVGSTVMPGSCDSEVLPLLEQASGRRVGETLGLCYSPEFIALGTVLRDLVAPDMVLIGESDRAAGDALERLYRGVCENNPPFRRMSLLNSELTKIAVNTYVTMKISYANTLADICERLDGADSDTVADALGLDSRIGPKYLRGATAYGGPCFPRDTKAFAALARDVHVEPLLAEATDAVNSIRIDRLAQVTQSHLADGASVGILGLAYKPGTSVVDESAGVALAGVLADAGYDVHVYDPVVDGETVPEIAGMVRCSRSLDEIFRDCDVVVITTPWPEFSALSAEALRSSTPRRRVVIDCWRVLSEPTYANEIDIVRLGRRQSSLLELHGLKGSR